MSPRSNRHPPKPHTRTRVSEETPVLLSDEQKRELILAHASSREGRKQDWGVGYSIAIAASFLIVLSGWFLTLGSDGGTVRAPDPLVQSLRETSERIKNEGAPQAKQAAQAINDAVRTVSTSTTPTTNP